MQESVVSRVEMVYTWTVDGYISFKLTKFTPTTETIQQIAV